MADTQEDSGQDSAVPGSAAPRPEIHRPHPHLEKDGAEQRAGTGASSGTRGSEWARGQPRTQHGHLSVYLQHAQLPLNYLGQEEENRLMCSPALTRSSLE